MGEPFGTLAALSDTRQLVANPAEDVRGRSVVDSGGEKIGTVADLLIETETNHVRFLRVEHGGVLGFGAQASFVPVEAIVRVTEDEVHVDSSKEHVAGGPRYDPDLIGERSYYEKIYGHYGQIPPYAPGSMYPGLTGLTGGPGLPPIR
jgi:sporulation protein YlmC with PRC-barrel domain